jgi:8-amino-7-oxononanoate synthase
MPVARRAEAAAATWASGRGAPPAAPAPPPRGAGPATTSSTSAFHAWHAGHWPSQRGAACPHCWQTNAVRRRLSTKDATRVDKRRRGRHVPGVQALDVVLDAELADLEARALRRGLIPLESASDGEVVVRGRPVLLLSSNNYLGLATHPALRAAAAAAIARWGCGAGASRLICGHFELHAAVEAKLAAFHGTEAALLFPSGYQANVGALGALVGRGDRVFSDALNHASIIDGCRLSRATVHVYPHGDVEALARMLAAAPPGGRRLVVTDSVFSMDGDRAPLPELVAVAEQYHSWLMLDEAHATGVLGPRGAGLAEACGLAGRVAVHVGTLSKALGGAGGYVAGSRALIDALVNRARSFVYTTGIAPAAAAAAGAALDVIAAEPERRHALLRNAAHLREGLRRLGFAVGGDTHILPVMVGDNGQALALAAALLERGVLVQAIRPPTVPPGTARLRVTPMATHTPAQLDRALAAFAEAGRATGVLR